MISCLFGVPRVGKNTVLTMIAQKALKSGKYEHVYTSFACDGCERVKFSDLEVFRTPCSLVIFDEMGVDADGRKFKEFSDDIRDYLVYHGHDFVQFLYATQNYANVDKKIRDLTEELWYLEKSCLPILRNFTRGKKIFRTIAINDMTSDLVMGYRFAELKERLFSKVCMTVYRPKWYKYFDSWELGPLEHRPVLQSEKWTIVPRVKEKKNNVLKELNEKCSDILVKADVLAKATILQKSTILQQKYYNKSRDGCCDDNERW